MNSRVLIAGLLLSTLLPGASMVEEVGLLAAARDHEERFTALEGLLKAHGLAWQVEEFDTPRRKGRNIVVTVGSGPAHILFGAHYDAILLPDGTPSRGAVDNGGSVAILVRLAEALRTENLPLQIRLVWFDLEEYGLLGSKQYLAAHANDRPQGMVNLDINAFGDTIVFAQSQDGSVEALRRSVLIACAEELTVCLPSATLPSSDDRSFAQARVPTVSIATLDAVQAHQVWLLLNAGPLPGLAPGFVPPTMTMIHTPNDTVDKVQEASLARTLRVAVTLAKQLATSSPPR